MIVHGEKGIRALRTLEEKFGSPHPELEKFKTPEKEFRWLSKSFFSLHRRREYRDSGPQPLSVEAIISYGTQILDLPSDMLSFYYRVMEACDDMVMSHSYGSSKADAGGSK